MARFCFYCNRELAAGESCQCRLRAREQQRRAGPEPNARPGGAAYQDVRGAGERTPPKRQTNAFRLRELMPTASDFLKPLDQMELEKPNAAAAAVWIGLSLLLQGAFVAALTKQPPMFFLGVLFGLVSLLLLVLLLYLRMRLRTRRQLKLGQLFAKARPVYLYASLIFLLATFAGFGNPVFGILLFLLGDLAAKTGLLWQIRQSSPLDRNRFFLTALLTLVFHTLFQSVLIQRFLGGLFAGL